MIGKDRTVILLVEDNPLDVYLTRIALREERDWTTEIVVAEDGEKAIHYLLRKEEFESVQPPDLVILDLNLPKRDGSEVLGTIRSDANLSRLPVIILSSSPEDVVRDQVKATTAKPDWILTKPVGAPEFLALGRKFRECFREAAERRVSSALLPAVPTTTN